MKKIVLIFLFIFFSLPVNATTLKAGVSIEDIPKALFGSWRVNAKLDTTNSNRTFRPQSVDFWNLSRYQDVIKLDNPFSGASAEISVQTVEGNIVVFSKRLPYDGNKVLTDTVTLRLNENEFSGINSLTLETLSQLDNHVIKTESATYMIKGEKISGDSIISTEN